MLVVDLLGDQLGHMESSGAIHHYFNFQRSESMRGEVLVMSE